MNNIQIIVLGWIVGQIGYAACSIYNMQKDKENVNYLEAAKAYFAKEVGSFVMAFSGLLILLFIFPDFWDTDLNRMDYKLKPVKTWKEWIMIYQRCTAVVLGGLSQHLIYLIFRRGKKEIQKLDDEKSKE